GVALGQGVGGDETGLTVLVKQLVSPEYEVGHEVGTAPRTSTKRADQMLPIRRPQRAGDLLAAQEGGIADDGVEAALFKDLGEDQGPVQRAAVKGPGDVVGGKPPHCLLAGLVLAAGALGDVVRESSRL